MASEWSHLTHAPIAEAVIEFQFDGSENVTLESLKSIAEKLKELYPNQNQKRGSVIKALVKDSGPETEIVDKGVVGISARSEDGNKILQLLQDRFAFSHLQPYTKWGDLEKDTFYVWNCVIDEIDIECVKRVGVRFINRIEIDMPIESFSDYIVSAPIIPEGIPQGISAYEQRVIIPNPDNGAIAIVNQSMGGLDSEKNVVPVILDIDVGMAGRYVSKEENLKKILGPLREYKNDMFFRNITDKVVRKYQ